MPGWAYPGPEPDAFMGRDEVVEHLEAYATSFHAPVSEGVRVERVERRSSDDTFLLSTSSGVVQARRVVLATGSLQRPNIPPWAAGVPNGVAQISATEYRIPSDLPPGAIVVVGSGESGCQISAELARSGRTVFLVGGRAWWAPRRYRGRDISAWWRLTGWFERTVDDLPPGRRAGQPNAALTGAEGGHDISVHTLVRDGVRPTGRLVDIRDGTAVFADDLAANVAWGDGQCRATLASVDRVIALQGISAPSPDAPDDLRHAGALPAATARAIISAPATIDLVREGVRTIIWATGYRPDFSWVGLPFLAHDGYPIQRRGVTDIPGLYVLGLDWLHNAKSGLFAGLSDDATYLHEFITSRSGRPPTGERNSGDAPRDRL